MRPAFALACALGACLTPFTWWSGHLTRPAAGALSLGLILAALLLSFLSE